MLLWLQVERQRPASLGRSTPKPIKRVPPSMQQELALLETMTQETAPRPAEDALVALY